MNLKAIFSAIMLTACTMTVQAQQLLKPRVVIMTDIAPATVEPDDQESMVRLLVYADQLEIEGVITTVGWNVDPYPTEWADSLYRVVNAYAVDVNNLMKRSGQTSFRSLKDEQTKPQPIGYWPSADYIRSRVAMGSQRAGIGVIGAENDTPGSQLIIKLVDEADERPIWFLAWGSANTLAQAIWRVKQERTPEELQKFVSKCRLYTITDQDMVFAIYQNLAYSSHQWLRREFGSSLLTIWDETAWITQASWGVRTWPLYEMMIQGRGEMGKAYPHYRAGVEGDTPSFLHVLPNGLNDPDKPEQIGWGGMHFWNITKDSLTYAWTYVEPDLATMSREYEQRYYFQSLYDFAARMQWAADGKGNLNPKAIVNGQDGLAPIYLTAAPGEKLLLDASASSDPNGDLLSFRWWVQPEAGTYKDAVTIRQALRDKPTVIIPEDATGQTIHIILEVSDNGRPALISYRRVIIKVSAPQAVFSDFIYEGHDAIYDKHPLKSDDQTYNPILPGWYSDPSICRDDKGDYWLVSSTFGAYPGVPLFHSRDLMNWQQVGSILTRPEQLPLAGQDFGMNGIYAASIFYNRHNQTYYMITTNVGLYMQRKPGNFVVKAKDPRGPWSDPVYLKNLMGIDPSLFFDDDGKAYVVYAQMHNREYPGHNSIIMHEYDVEADSVKVETERVIAEKNVYADHLPYCVEGPHLYRINGRYYLMCAEGGTELNHAEVIFRSDNVWGEYKPWEGNPILTQRDLGPRKDGVYCAGHADIFQDGEGRWWSVFLGTRRVDGKLENLGRETFLMPLKWTSNGWPYITRPGEQVPLFVTIPGAKRSNLSSWENPGVEGFAGGNFTVRETFDSLALAPYWQTIRGAATDYYSLAEQPGNLVLKCISRTASDRSAEPAFVGRRLHHHHFNATTHISFQPKGKERAGLLLYKSEKNQYFLALGQNQGHYVLDVLKIGEGGQAQTLASKTVSDMSNLSLRISSESGHTFSFSYSADGGKKWQKVADGVDANFTATQVQGTSNGFTGTLVGMYAVRDLNP